MNSQDPRMRPETARIIDSDSDQPYAKRTISTIFIFIIALVLMGAFVGWYFFTPSFNGGPENSEQATSSENKEPQLPGNNYEEGSGRSFLYNFFYQIFGGIDEGLEDSPHNLENVERIDDNNIDTNNLLKDSTGSNRGSSSGRGAANEGIEATMAVKESVKRGAASQSRSSSQADDQYRHSIYDVIGSEVYSQGGRKRGIIHDILVHKETGKAKAIIVNDKRERYERNLNSISFNRVSKQEDSGVVVLTVAQEKEDQKPEFSYTTLENTEYVSLRRLRDGRILDSDGKVAGQIDAIIYENAEAQNIYFTLRPVLAQQGPSKFTISFKDVNIKDTQNSSDIQLTKRQTEALALMLFQSDSQGQTSNSQNSSNSNSNNQSDGSDGQTSSNQ